MTAVRLPRPESCPACRGPLPAVGWLACSLCEWCAVATPLEHRVSSLLRALDDLYELEDWEVMDLLCRVRLAARERRVRTAAFGSTRPT